MKRFSSVGPIYSIFLCFFPLWISLVSSCVVNSDGATESQRVLRPDSDAIPKALAVYRKAQLGNIDYDFVLTLPEEDVPFSGVAKISFDLIKKDGPLIVDFVGGEVNTLLVNSLELDANYNGFNLLIPLDHLEPGFNTIEIHYAHAYSRDGRGLSWFKDPNDGETYLATQFEPDDFNKVFPGFDQPNLRASYTLKVNVPGHWKVVSAEEEVAIDSLPDGRALWIFPKTKRFSTYLMSVHAGPFETWEDTDFRVPLRIYARKSYSDHVEAEKWFDITRRGFDYFEKLFGVPYPFGRYDQLLIPEKGGAMENVGAVTYSEWFHPRRKMNDRDFMSLSIVTMHEMAHQWFGNLVTMEWWDDLWLNESFADMMGYVATSEATPYKGALERFAIKSKGWAYGEDQWITTHAVSQKIPDSQSVSAYFDGITYAKGAAILFQLKHLLGEERFYLALQDYFQNHKWSNTTAIDFFQSMELAAERRMDSWSQTWFKESGVNRLSTEFSCSDGLVTELLVKQAPANNSLVLREHQMDLKLLGSDDSVVNFGINVVGEITTVNSALGLPCPAMVFPNASDHAYATWNVDEQSYRYLFANFDRVTHPVERAIIWRSLWESVVDGDLPTNDFFNFNLKYLPLETDVNVVETQLTVLGYAYSFFENYDTIRDTESAVAQHYRQKIADLSRHKYMESEGAMRRAWFYKWVWSIAAESEKDEAAAMLSSDIPVDDKWQIVMSLSSMGYDKSQELIASLQSEDGTSHANDSAIAAKAIAPNVAVKKFWLNEMSNRESMYTDRQLSYAMRGLFPALQYELQLSLGEVIERKFAAVIEARPEWFAAGYAWGLPVHCTSERAKDFQRLAHQYSGFASIRKALLMKSHIETRCANQLENMNIDS